MSNLCIIPARGGSKRIPRKNLKNFLGKPIIIYTIEAALTSALFEEVMVSTDDFEIAEVAKRNGANVPFLRSANKANDFATLAEVVEEVVSEYREKGIYFDKVCCILPTSPFVTSSRILEAYNKMNSEMLDSVCPVVEFSYPILRALEISADNKLKMIWPEHLATRSQDIKPAYHDSGSFYWVRTSALLSEKTLFCDNGSMIILPETEVQDIDTEIDWKLAELKYKLKNET